MEIETLLHLQQSGHFPSDIDVFRTTPEIPTTENENRIQIAKKLSTPVRKRAHSKKNKNGNMDVLDVELTTTLNNFDLWLCHNALKRIPHNTPQYGNCLFESIANALPIWNGKPVELRLKSLKWAQLQVSKGTEWGKQMWKRFDETKGNPDTYGKNSYLDYLVFLMDPQIYGTEYDIIMLCEFLNVCIEIYSSSLVKFEDGKLVCQKPLLFGDLNSPKILLWHYKEHYEQIIKIGVNI